jgi:hypothetical protein
MAEFEDDTDTNFDDGSHSNTETYGEGAGAMVRIVSGQSSGNFTSQIFDTTTGGFIFKEFSWDRIFGPEGFETASVLDSTHLQGVGFDDHIFNFEGAGGASYWIETGPTPNPYGGSKCIGQEITNIGLSRRNEFNITDIDELAGTAFKTHAWYYLPAGWVLDAGGGNNWYAIMAWSSGAPNWYPYTELHIIDMDSGGGSGDFKIAYIVRDNVGVKVQHDQYSYFPLPLGEWFTIETEFSQPDLYFNAWIDGIDLGRYDYDADEVPQITSASHLTISKMYFDTAQTLPIYQWIDDITITRLSAYSNVSLQIRAGDQADLSDASFEGPTGTGDYFTSSPTNIPSRWHGKRYIQYKIFFTN